MAKKKSGSSQCPGSDRQRSMDGAQAREPVSQLGQGFQHRGEGELDSRDGVYGSDDGVQEAEPALLVTEQAPQQVRTSVAAESGTELPFTAPSGDGAGDLPVDAAGADPDTPPTALKADDPPAAATETEPDSGRASMLSVDGGCSEQSTNQPPAASKADRKATACPPPVPPKAKPDSAAVARGADWDDGPSVLDRVDASDWPDLVDTLESKQECQKFRDKCKHLVLTCIDSPHRAPNAVTVVTRLLERESWLTRDLLAMVSKPDPKGQPVDKLKARLTEVWRSCTHLFWAPAENLKDLLGKNKDSVAIKNCLRVIELEALRKCFDADPKLSVVLFKHLDDERRGALLDPDISRANAGSVLLSAAARAEKPEEIDRNCVPLILQCIRVLCRESDPGKALPEKVDWASGWLCLHDDVGDEMADALADLGLRCLTDLWKAAQEAHPDRGSPWQKALIRKIHGKIVPNGTLIQLDLPNDTCRTLLGQMLRAFETNPPRHKELLEWLISQAHQFPAGLLRDQPPLAAVLKTVLLNHEWATMTALGTPKADETPRRVNEIRSVVDGVAAPQKAPLAARLSALVFECAMWHMGSLSEVETHGAKESFETMLRDDCYRLPMALVLVDFARRQCQGGGHGHLGWQTACDLLKPYITSDDLCWVFGSLPKPCRQRFLGII